MIPRRSRFYLPHTSYDAARAYVATMPPCPHKAIPVAGDDADTLLGCSSIPYRGDDGAPLAILVGPSREGRPSVWAD